MSRERLVNSVQEVGLPFVIFGIVVVVIVLVLVARRHNELFLISVRDGEMMVVRGSVPGRMLWDIRDVITSANVKRATIRGVRRESHATITTTGLDENIQQRLRNVFGLYPMSKLTSPQKKSRHRNLGQILGWMWLAWLLRRRR